MIDQLPSHLVRGGVVPYLTSVDALALRSTSKAMVSPCRDIRILINEITSGRLVYWKWIGCQILCGCGSCKPVQALLRRMGKVAPLNVIRSFCMSLDYTILLSVKPSVLSGLIEGGAASKSLKRLLYCRSYCPVQNIKAGVIACAEFGFYNGLKTLVGIGDRMDLTAGEIALMLFLCVSRGDLPSTRAVLGIGVRRSDAVAGVEIAVRHDHHKILDALDDEFDLVDRENMRKCIVHDSLDCLIYHLRAGIWPTEDDSELLYSNPQRVVQYWKDHDLPTTPAVRAWLRYQ